MKKKKIGILTFHFAINYGAILQCYGLYKYLCKQNFSPVIINYVPLKVSDHKDDKLINFIRFCFKPLIILKRLYNSLQLIGFNATWIKFRYGRSLKTKFSQFHSQYLSLTPLCHESDIAFYTNTLDAIIVGSDQVWNHHFHDNPVYFFSWTPPFKGKRLSYSACSGNNKVDYQNRQNIANLLNKFNFISVRGSETNSFIHDLTGLNVDEFADPTFLVDYDELVIKDHYLTTAPYILTYVIGKEITGNNLNMIKEIKRHTGDLKVISIVLSESHPQKPHGADKILYNTSIEEWVTLFKKASFIYTDSFHGAIFAIKNNIDFVAYVAEDQRKARFFDLFKKLNCLDRLIYSYTDCVDREVLKKNINYEEINKSLNTYRQHSLTQFSSALHGLL